MRCEECQELISEHVSRDFVSGELVEGTLPSDTTKAMSAHLDGCAACRLFLENHHALNRLLGLDRDVEPSAGFDEAFFAWLAEERPSRLAILGAWLRPKLVLPVAASLAVALVTVSVLTHRAARDDDRWNSPKGDEQKFIAENQELLSEFDVVQNLDAVENYETISHLDDLLKAD